MMYGTGQFKTKEEQKVLLLEKLENNPDNNIIIGLIKEGNIESAIENAGHISDWYMQKLKRLNDPNCICVGPYTGRGRIIVDADYVEDV